MDWIFEKGRIYCLDDNREVMAETTYIFKDNGEVDIDHTLVNPALRGQGVAGAMMKVVATHLLEKKLKATASCAYANAWLRKNANSYSDVISEDMGDDFGACKV